MNKVLRFILFVLGLAIIAAAFGIIGALIGGRVIGETTFGSLGLAIIGLFVLYLAGIIIGLILIKKVFHQSGSVLLGLLGAIIAIVIMWILGFTWDAIRPAFFPVIGIAAPTISLAGFYLKK